jgi:anti-anti-sigma factor
MSEPSRVSQDRVALRPTIRVDSYPAIAPDYGAVIRMCGEHDVASADDLERALAPFFCDVLVDLSDCAFIDSTTIGVLVRGAKSLEREGHRLDLLPPADASSVVARIVSVTGLASFLRVLDHSTLRSSASPV